MQFAARSGTPALRHQANKRPWFSCQWRVPGCASLPAASALPRLRRPQTAPTRPGVPAALNLPGYQASRKRLDRPSLAACRCFVAFGFTVMQTASRPAYLLRFIARQTAAGFTARHKTPTRYPCPTLFASRPVKTPNTVPADGAGRPWPVQFAARSGTPALRHSGAPAFRFAPLLPHLHASALPRLRRLQTAPTHPGVPAPPKKAKNKRPGLLRSPGLLFSTFSVRNPVHKHIGLSAGSLFYAVLSGQSVFWATKAFSVAQQAESHGDVV